jgi:hypothetical protein
VTVVRSRLGFFVPFLVAVLLTLVGCGDDPDDVQPTGQTPAPSGESSEPPPSAEPTGSGESSAPAGETVEPAAGDLLELSNVSVRAPKGFDADPPDGSNLRFAFARVGIQSIALANTSSLDESQTLLEQARISLRTNVYPRPPKLMEPVEIDGVRMYHYAGRISEHEYVEEYGTIYDGSQISINFRLEMASSEAERQGLVASVMASLRFL